MSETTQQTALQKLQISYRRNHSVQTAVTIVYNDLIINKSRGKDTLLVLSDFSAAFDTVDQVIFLNDLFALGIDDIVLELFRTYHKNSKFRVYVKDTLSDENLSSSGKYNRSHLISYLYN